MAWAEPVPVWMAQGSAPERCWLFANIETGWVVVVGPDGERRFATSAIRPGQELPDGVYLTRLKAAYSVLPRLETELAQVDELWERNRQTARSRLTDAVATCKRILAGQE